jgi:hypothetical protein
MLKKHLPLIGLLIGLSLLIVATTFYPGGSQQDVNSVGFDWKNNYLCNLFFEKAMNGSANGSRSWAIAGWFIICLSFALFFIDFSAKMALKSAATVVRYSGIAAMTAYFLVVTPFHDMMVTIGLALSLVTLFYIIVCLFKSRLTFLKILSIACILTGYWSAYIYYTRNHIGILPVMQKITMLGLIILLLSLQYFTRREDFEVSGQAPNHFREKI